MFLFLFCTIFFISHPIYLRDSSPLTYLSKHATCPHHQSFHVIKFWSSQPHVFYHKSNCFFISRIRRSQSCDTSHPVLTFSSSHSSAHVPCPHSLRPLHFSTRLFLSRPLKTHNIHPWFLPSISITHPSPLSPSHRRLSPSPSPKVDYHHCVGDMPWGGGGHPYMRVAHVCACRGGVLFE